jgi:hypothetical protein
MEEEAIKKLIAMLSVNTGEDVTYEYASARINELVWLYGELRKWEQKRLEKGRYDQSPGDQTE